MLTLKLPTTKFPSLRDTKVKETQNLYNTNRIYKFYFMYFVKNHKISNKNYQLITLTILLKKKKK